MSNGYEQAYRLMEEIWGIFSKEDRKWFLKEEPIAMHHSLGRHLRNHAKLWENPWQPLIIDGVDYSKEHPDAISHRVIKDFQYAMVSK